MFHSDLLKEGSKNWHIHKVLCKQIITELRSFPCSYIFDSDCDCEFPDSNNPSSKKSKTLSFKIILENIDNGTYKELKDFIFDMKLLLSTLIKKNYSKEGKQKPIFNVSVDYLKRFQKRMGRFDQTTIQGWYKTIAVHKLRIDHLLQNSTPATQPYFPFPTPEPYPTKVIGSQHIEFILEYSTRIKDPLSVRKLLNIIKNDYRCPTIPKDGTLEVDLHNLQQTTIRRIYDFIAARTPPETHPEPSNKKFHDPVL